MSDIKSRVQRYDPAARARDIQELTDKTGNIYKSLVIIAKRAKQLNVEIKRELNDKLEEFAITNDNIEEIQENKEQIEISKFYERLPNPALIATEEFLENRIQFRDKVDDDATSSESDDEGDL